MAHSAPHRIPTLAGEQDGPSSPARRERLRACYQVSALVGLLLAVAAGMGLFVPGIYQDNTAFAAAAFRGTGCHPYEAAQQSRLQPLGMRAVRRRGGTAAGLDPPARSPVPAQGWVAAHPAGRAAAGLGRW
jgi:hypothetical protein